MIDKILVIDILFEIFFVDISSAELILIMVTSQLLKIIIGVFLTNLTENPI